MRPSRWTKMKPYISWLTGWVGGLVLATAMQAAELGDPAPPLRIAQWVKGEPVDLAAGKGKTIYVVEFWATWCGPCRTSIPHLTELQKKFKDKGVVFIGVSDEKVPVVKSFVDKMADKMDYVVAVDQDRKTSAGYMEAYQQGGIPHAFIVDKESRVVWHGHPMGELEATLQQLLDGKYDMAVAQKRAEAQVMFREFWQIAGDPAQASRADVLAKKLEALDEELGGFLPGRRFNAKEVRKQAEFNGAMREYQRALFEGDEEAKVAELEQRAEGLAPEGFQFKEMKQSMRLQALFQRYLTEAKEGGDAEKAKELGNKLKSAECKNPALLNEVAWAILTDEDIRKRDLELAMYFAKAAYDGCEGKDASIVDTYARALFDTGKTEQAIEAQKRAVALCEDQEMKDKLSATLKDYEKKRLGK